MHGFLSSTRAIARRSALAAREFGAAFADDRFVAQRLIHDEIVDVGRLGRRDHLLVGGVFAGVAQIGRDRVVEEVRLLRHDADVGPQRRERHVAHVDAVDAHAARLRVVEARHQLRDRGLARAGGTHECGHRPGSMWKLTWSSAGLSPP